MKNRSKRYQEAVKKAPENMSSIEEAIDVLKELPATKFDQTVELNFYLGIDPKQSTQVVRGTVSLPHGTGKAVKVLVFCRGEEAKEAELAGADYIGADELIAKVASGWIDFDVVVAHPNMMKEISKLGKVLGPRGMMPSPKVGTVTTDIAKAVTEVKKGKIEFKSDKSAGLHVPCGKISFSKDALNENANVIIKTVVEHKPSGSKGVYLRSLSVSSTMSPGISIDTRALSTK